jgi:hypothetical protein
MPPFYYTRYYAFVCVLSYVYSYILLFQNFTTFIVYLFTIVVKPCPYWGNNVNKLLFILFTLFTFKRFNSIYGLRLFARP